MKYAVTLVFGVAAAVAIAVAQFAVAADHAEGRKDLSGSWKGAVENGATGHELTFTAELISATKDGKQDLGAGTFTVDQSTKPWSMDAVRTKGGKEGQLNLGIYSLEGDTLKWCVDPAGKERPTKFATEGGNFLLVLKRVKS
jgi:uncharacterized protein (TIGR03067 family)